MSRSIRVAVCTSLFLAIVALSVGVASAQAPLGNDQYAFKIYAVNSAFYPIVQLYLRSWDENRDPLKNVNYMNVGLMVKGRNYDPAKIDPQTRGFQYGIETLENREEGFRTVLVLDCSLSMAGKPFADAQNALMEYVNAKRPADQIAVIAIRDTDTGYELVSGFEKSPTTLYQLIKDVQCDGQKTRLYDSVAAAMEMCATASQGGTSNQGAEHAVLSTILVLSDGKDEGSAVARDELMNRIGQLPIPIPIYALAYSNADKSSFSNLEALSKGSFGRYWTHEDSQEFGKTVQTIHRINRSDFVVTFRSYVPVDGERHAVKLGISWPSNTGRFVFDSAEFEAIESPALYMAETRAIYEKLQQAYPMLADGCPYMNCPDSAGQVTPINDNPKPPVPDPAPKPEPDPVPERKEGSMLGFFKENTGMLGLGAGILVLLVLLLLWVNRGGANRGTAASKGLPSTDPRQGRGSGPKNGHGTPFPEPASKSSDTTTRF